MPELVESRKCSIQEIICSWVQTFWQWALALASMGRTGQCGLVHRARYGPLAADRGNSRQCQTHSETEGHRRSGRAQLVPRWRGIGPAPLKICQNAPA